MAHTFVDSSLALAAGALFTALLAAACVMDVRARRIPNGLVLALLLAGVGFTAVVGQSPAALLRSVAALALGFAIWIPLHALGKLGAGDVKLFAAASAWLTPAAVVDAALLSALIGGALALVWMLRTQGAAATVFRLAHGVRQPALLRQPLPAGMPPATTLPYGVAMALGLALAAWLPHLPR